GSELVKRSAEAPRQTRGDTLQAALMTETSVWRDIGPLSADETATSLQNALADGLNTVAIIDTTAKGAAGFTYDTWCQASWIDEPRGEPNLFQYWRQYGVSRHEKPDKNDYLRVFAAWWEFPEHRRPVVTAEVKDIQGSLTEREKSGIQRFGWTWEQ